MESTASRRVNTTQEAEAYMSLSTSSLAISETGCHTTLENGLHQRFGCEPKEKNSIGHKLNSFSSQEKKKIVACKVQVKKSTSSFQHFNSRSIVQTLLNRYYSIKHSHLHFPTHQVIYSFWEMRKKNTDR